MKNINKKIITEAYQRLSEVNRMKKLAGLNEGGCMYDHLGEEYQNTFMNSLIKEAETEVTWWCSMKSQEVDNGDGTGSAKACEACKNYVCSEPEKCRCIKTTSPASASPGMVGGRGGKGSYKNPVREVMINEAEYELKFIGCAININRDLFGMGPNMEFDICDGSNCQDCFDKGCSCNEEVVVTGSVGSPTGGDPIDMNIGDIEPISPTDPTTPIEPEIEPRI